MKTGERYYDTTMIQSILQVSQSKLKREMAQYGFTGNDYIKYNNRFLIMEEAVISFIDYLATRYSKQINGNTTKKDY